MGVREIVISGAVPFGIALVVLGIGWLVVPRLGGKRVAGGDGAEAVERRGPLFLLPVLAGLLTLFGAYAWQTRVDLWADSATHRFPVIGIAAALAGLVCSLAFVRTRWWAVAVVAGLAGGFSAWAFLSTVHPSFLGSGGRWGGVVGVGFAVALQAIVLERAGEKLVGFRGPALVSVLIGVIGLGATVSFANAPLIVSGAGAAFGALALIGLVPKSRGPAVSIAGGGGVAAAVLIGGVAAFSNWLGDEYRWSMLGLLLAAPLGVGAVLVLWKPLNLEKRRNVALVVAAVPALAIAGVQAGIAVPHLMSATSGDDPYAEYGY